MWRYQPILTVVEMQWMLSTYLIVWSNIFSGDRSKEANFFPFSWQKYPGTPPGVWVGPASSQKCWIRHFTFLSLGHSYCFAYFSRLYVTLDTLFFQIIPLVAIIGAGVGGAVSYVGYMLLTKQDYRYSNILFIVYAGRKLPNAQKIILFWQ